MAWAKLQQKLNNQTILASWCSIIMVLHYNNKERNQNYKLQEQSLHRTYILKPNQTQIISEQEVLCKGHLAKSTLGWDPKMDPNQKLEEQNKSETGAML